MVTRAYFLSLLLVTGTWAQVATRPALEKAVDQTQVALTGGRMTASDAADREARVLQDPTDLQSRIMLLGYYFAQQASDEVKPKRQSHIIWLIQNAPREEIVGTPFGQINRFFDKAGYAAAHVLWIGLVDNNDNDPVILRNAASFFSNDDPELTEKYLKQGKALEPTQPYWPKTLAGFYSRRGAFAQEPLKSALQAQAATESEEALKLTGESLNQFYMLADLAKTQLEAGHIDKAEEYANRLLTQSTKYRRDWNYGNAIHKGNLILGRIALKKGDVEAAKRYLLASGQTPGSPQLDSFGPNMSLARELLEKGEKDVVIQYFDLCGKFWKTGSANLKAWTETVKAGGTPNFGANLVY